MIRRHITWLNTHRIQAGAMVFVIAWMVTTIIEIHATL